jgi:Trk K+ transport system NAD-binding subunit
MSTDAWIMLCILVAMFVLLIWDRLPAWMVFIGTFTVCLTLGLAPPQNMLNGFANSGVITVAALYPVAAGMYSTGAITLISQRFIGLPKSLRAAYLKIIPPTAIGSAFLNNTPLVAMMIPVVRDITRMTGLQGAKIYMFISFGSILGGASTLIGTSTNLIIAGLVSDAINSGQLQNMEPITIFEPTKIGLPAALAGILFMIFIAARLLPEHKAEVVDQAKKRMYRAEFVVIPKSSLAGKTVEEAGFAEPSGYHLDSIVKPDGILATVSPTARLNDNDRLVFISEADAVPALWATIGLKPAYGSGPKAEKDRFRHSLVEAVVSARAPSVGHLISELPLPDSPYNIHIVGISRDGQAPEVPLIDLRVEPGDGGILEVNDEFFYQNRRELDFATEKPLRGYSVQRVSRAMAATVIAVAMVLLAALNVMSMLNAALLAGIAMFLTGCITA